MSRILYLSERATGTADSPLDTYVPAWKNLPPVPYMSKISQNLYVGGVNPTLVLPPWIEYVVSLHPVEYRVVSELEGFAHFRAADSQKQDPAVFSLASAVASQFWAKGPTLIHCAVGLNRACATAALTLMEVQGLSSYTAIETLRSARSPAVLFNKAFEEYVHSQNRVATVSGPINTPNRVEAPDGYGTVPSPVGTVPGKNIEDSDFFKAVPEDDEPEKTRLFRRSA